MYVVVTGGGPPDRRAIAAVRAALDHSIAGGPRCRVIAADGGLDVARAGGIEPDELIGDLDSITPDGLAWAEAQGVPIDRHPPAKDETDTELAIARAADLAAAAGAPADLLVVGGTGSELRVDHLLGTIGALGRAAGRFARVSAWLGPARLHVVAPDRRVALDLDPGTTFSVLAAHGDCHGVSIAGARWSLDGVDLPAGSTRGISNRSSTQPVTVSVRSGTLTVVIP